MMRTNGNRGYLSVFISVLVFFLLSVLCGCVGGPHRGTEEPSPLIGMWHTQLPLSRGPVWFSISITAIEEGYASVWIPELRVREVNAAITEITATSLAFNVDGGKVSFQGVLNEDETITGKWSHYGSEFTVNLRKTPSSGFVSPDKYVEESIILGTTDQPVKGRLTLPSSSTSYPLVILVSGSGPNDYDETLGPNRSFRQLAHSLAAEGIASLRYDKRTFLYPGVLDIRPAEDADYIGIEYTEDFIEALQFASKLPNVEALFALGHSLGGKVLPGILLRISLERAKALQGIILAAAPARSLAELAISQNIYLVENGLVRDEGGELEEAIRVMKKVRDHEYAPGFLIRPGLEAAYYYDTDRYDPLEDLSQINLPVLIIQGDEDFQVSSEEDWKVFKEGYGGKERFRFALIEGMNHMFLEQPDDLPSLEDYYVPSAISSDFVEVIVHWVLSQTTGNE